MRRSLASRASGLTAALLVALSAPGSALAHGVAHFEAAHHDVHVDEHVGECHGEHEASDRPSPVDRDLGHESAYGPARAEIETTDHPADHGHQTLGPATTGRLDSPLMLPSQVPAQWTVVVASREELKPERVARQELATAEGVPRQPRAPPLG